MPYLELDYITYSVLEVMDSRQGKKFYPEEILEDIIGNEYICHDFIDFTIDTIRFGLGHKATYMLFGYKLADNYIEKCKKYKKEAYRITWEGQSIVRDYKNARRFYLCGFKNCNTIINPHFTDYDTHSLAVRSWYCLVSEEFKKNIDGVKSDAENERILNTL